MRSALFEINGQAVDLPASLKGVFKLQNAAAALQDLDARTGEYSFPLTLPPTRRNALVFGQKRHPQALDKFAGAYAFTLRVGGQAWAGTWRPTGYKNGYVGALVMDGFGWALALGDKKLTDLTTLAPVDYDGSQLAAILALNCDQTDVQFPLVAFGNFFGPPLQITQADGTVKAQPLPASPVLDYPLSVDDYFPSVYYVNLVRAILREAGYFAQGPALEDADVRTWCVTAAGGSGTAWPWGALLPAAATGGRQRVYAYLGGNNHGNENSYENTAVDLDESTGLLFLPLAVPRLVQAPTRALDGPRGQYTAPVEGVYRFRWSATLTEHDQKFADQGKHNADGLALMVPICLGLVVQRGGETLAEADGGLLTRGNFDFTQQRVVAPVRVDSLNPGAYGAATDDVYLAPGDTVRLMLLTRRRWFPEVGSEDGIWREKFDVSFSAAEFACTYFEDVDGVSRTQLQPAALLPPLAQKDVLRDFLLRTNALLTADPERMTATLDFRPGYTTAQGPAVDLTDRVDPDAYESLPVLSTAEALAFAPADPGDDGLVTAATDTVRIDLASAAAVPGQVKTVAGTFAAVGLRTYYLPGGHAVALPTAAGADALATARSETSWDVSGAAPRVVRYLGPQSGANVPFQNRTVPLGGADYAGSLAWAGDAGAVAVRYPLSVAQARRGHRLRVPLPLSPAQYRQLTPGRRVWLAESEYTVESVSNWDACDDAGLCQLELLRVV